MATLKRRDGKLVHTAGGKLSTACDFGVIVEFAGMTNCGACDVSHYQGVPFFVPLGSPGGCGSPYTYRGELVTDIPGLPCGSGGSAWDQIRIIVCTNLTTQYQIVARLERDSGADLSRDFFSLVPGMCTGSCDAAPQTFNNDLTSCFPGGGAFNAAYDGTVEVTVL